jgi:hypothetical protein
MGLFLFPCIDKKMLYLVGKENKIIQEISYMKATVFYQDFSLNACRLGNSLAFNLLTAIKIKEFDIISENQFEVLNNIFEIMNHLDIDVGHPDRPLFEKAGHTSMSVGDFVVFEDYPDRIYLCDWCGWTIESTVTNEQSSQLVE